MLSNLLHDVRLALHSFARRPALAATVVLTLALGIGATTTVFTIVHGTMLKPLPYRDPERLVNVYRLPKTMLAQATPEQWVAGGWWIPPSIVRDWQASGSVFDSLGGYGADSFTARIGAEPESLEASMVTSGVFQALGVRPLLGDLLTPADDRAGGPKHAVLSHALWQRRFGGDRSVIGRVIMATHGRAGATPYTIVGVMPEGFGFPNGTEDLWVGLNDDRLRTTVRKAGMLQVIARLKPGVSVSAARTAVEQLSNSLAREHPEDKDFAVGVLRRLDVVSSGYARSLLLLLAAVGTVLLVAASNVANLLLVRAAERSREAGLRRALGAPGGRLIAAGLVESVLLALGGGLAGCVVAALSVGASVKRLPFALPRASEIQVDSRVLLFGLALSLVVGVLVGVLPALRATRVSVLDAVREGGRSVAGGRRRSRVQMTLVVTQVALVVVLLTVNGLFIRSLGELNRADVGFNAVNVLAVNATVPASQAGTDTVARLDLSRAFVRDLTARMSAIPGVRTVGAANNMPGFGWSAPSVLIETAGEPIRQSIVSNVITPGFFKAMEIPVVAGRSFTDDDREGTLPVAVVTQAFVQRFWRAENALGRRVKLEAPMWMGGPDASWMTVVGVVGDVRYSPAGKPMPTIYMVHAQQPSPFMNVVLKTSVVPASVAQAARAAVVAMNRETVVRSSVLSDRLAQAPSMVSRRFSILLIGGLAAAATLMALVGIYGLLAYGVAQRTHEIGIRMALGASRLSVVRWVMREGMIMAVAGLAAGGACTAAAVKFVRAMLVVSPADPATLTSVTALVLLVVAAASFIPARRATRVDPMLALRRE